MPAQPRTWGTGRSFRSSSVAAPPQILPRSRSASVSRTTPRPGMAVQGGSISTISPRALPRALIDAFSVPKNEPSHRRCDARTPERRGWRPRYDVDTRGSAETVLRDRAALFSAAQKSRDEFEMLGPIMAPSENAVPEMLRRYQWVTEPRAGLCDWPPVLSGKAPKQLRRGGEQPVVSDRDDTRGLVHLSQHSMVRLREGLELSAASGIGHARKSSARFVVVARRASRSSITASGTRAKKSDDRRGCAGLVTSS